MLKYFDAYVKFGLKPIAMHYKTKRPIGKNWNVDWNLEYWRNYFYQNKPYNMGILLGNIIDIECDNPESNKLLEDMLGNIPHPIYYSFRSIHHLFLTPDPTLTFQKIQGIEFRGNTVCSVVPPSVHESGAKYNFSNKSQFILSTIPDSLLNFYWENKNSTQKNTIPKKPIIKPGHLKTICKNCNYQKFIHKKRLVLEVKAFAKHGQFWMCHKCRKKINIEVREDCRSIKKQLIKSDYAF